MKKGILFFAVALMVCGMVWGQITPDTKPAGWLPGSNNWMNIWDMEGSFTAVPTISTEARYSAWRFSSDVDDYIDPRYHNQEIGTFFFLGGYPAGGGVDDTAVLTPADQTPIAANDPRFPYEISFGLGKTFGFGYIGVYYGGYFVDSYGWKDHNATDPDKYDVYRYSAWMNNLALLFGMGGNMGIRLDLVMEHPTEAETDNVEDKKYQDFTRTNSAGLSLTWGANMGKLQPYAKIGFTFPDTVTKYDDGDKATHNTGGNLGIVGGVGFDISENGSITADLIVGWDFKDTYKGDDAVITALGGPGEPAKAGGSWGAGLKAGYGHKLDFGKVAVGFKPALGLSFVSWNNNVSTNTDDKFPRSNYFSLAMGIDLGLKVQPTSKFAFYTGATLQFFEWDHFSLGGGDSDHKSKANQWGFEGIKWQDSQYTSKYSQGNLGFGMTFTPVENLVIGTGLNTILDKFFEIDLTRMQIRSGSAFDAAHTDQNNALGQALYVFDNITFDLTISYKIAGTPRASKQPAESAE